MVNIITNRVGYNIKMYAPMTTFLAIFLVLFIPTVNGLQTNCTDSETDTFFKYRVPLFNVTNTSSYIPITYGICNVTIYQNQLNVDNLINSSFMVHNGEGFYDCLIGKDFPTGKFNTFYECNVSTHFVQNHGRFEIVPDDVPLSIILFLVGVSALFIFYSMHLERNFLAVKALFFLSTFLIYFVIFVILFPLASEEGASQGVVDLTETVFVVYSILFLVIVVFTIIMIIIQILATFTAKKRAKDNIGVTFHD